MSLAGLRGGVGSKSGHPAPRPRCPIQRRANWQQSWKDAWMLKKKKGGGGEVLGEGGSDRFWSFWSYSQKKIHCEVMLRASNPTGWCMEGDGEAQLGSMG